MKGTRKTAAILAAILMAVAALAPAGSLAERKAENTEENGRVVKTVWKDENGQLCTGPEGYASVVYVYKVAQGITTEKYYDVNGNPCMCEGGYYSRAVSRNAKQLVTQIDYLDQDGKLMLNGKGYARLTISYYGFGAERLVRFLGVNNKPVKVPSLGYAQIYTEYSHYTMTARTFWDEKGEPVDGPDGYAAMKQKVDKKFRVLRIRYEHASGSGAMGPDGWSRCIKERDDEGRILSVKYYDEHDQLVDRGAGYAWEEYRYGENTETVTRYDLAGNKVSLGGSAVSLRRKYGGDRLIEETWLDENGNATPGPLGVSTVAYTYDLFGRVETVKYKDGAGQSCLNAMGYAGYRDSRDADGATVSRVYLGADGQPTATLKGYSEERYSYDIRKQRTETRYYDLNGTQVAGE